MDTTAVPRESRLPIAGQSSPTRLAKVLPIAGQGLACSWLSAAASVDMYNGRTEGVSPDNSFAESTRLPTELAQHRSASVDVYNGSTEGVSPDNCLAEPTRLP